MKITSYTYQEVDVSEITSIDLNQIPLVKEGWQAYIATAWDADRAQAESIQMIISCGRAGIVWRGDADWTDCDGPDDALDRYFGLQGKQMDN